MKAKLSFLARSVILLWMLVVGSVVHIDAKTIYFVNFNDWPGVNCHNWGTDGTTWPGTAMTKTDMKINGHDVYSVVLKNDANTSCIFSNNGSSETATLTVPNTDNALYDGTSWHEYQNARKIFQKASAISWWTDAGAVIKATFYPSNTTVLGNLVDATDKIYEFDMPGGWAVSFGRYNPDYPETAPWTTSGIILIPTDKNYATTFAENSSEANWDNHITKYYIKHPWGGGDWTWEELTYNSDGTCSITAVYGADGCNLNTKNNDDGATWVGSPTLVGNPASGDNCTFTYNPSNKTITITKNAPAVEYYINHPWNGGSSWDWKKLNGNGNGTYSLEGFYGNDGCNWNTISGNDGATWIAKSNVTLVDHPLTGDKCTFTLNPSANEGAGSLTITKISYNIVYEKNEGSLYDGAPDKYGSGAAVTLPTPFRSGYDFAGWYDSADFSGSICTEVAKGSTGDKTFYAKWTATPAKWVVHYESASGSWPDLELVQKEGNIYEAKLSIAVGRTVNFKVNKGSEWYSNNWDMTRLDCSDWTLSTDVAQTCRVKADITGDYTFTFNADTKKLTVTYPEFKEYYINHPWGKGEKWTWKKMTDNGNGTYSLEDYYGGDGCNWNTANADASNWMTPTLENNPQVGDPCTFTFDPSNNSIKISRDIYVVGRFKVRDCVGGNTIFTGDGDGLWNDKSKKIKFKYNEESDLYILPTYFTLSELSAISAGGDNQYYFFHLTQGSDIYGRDNDNQPTDVVPSNSPSNNNVKYNSGNNFIVSGSGNDYVTLLYDPANNKLWYETNPTNTTPVKIEVDESVVQWSYSVNGGTPINVKDGHKSEYVYLPAGENVTLTIKKSDSAGNITTDVKTYPHVRDEGNVIKIYWSNYNPDCARDVCSTGNTATHEKEILDQAWVWYKAMDGNIYIETDPRNFPAANHQGARLDSEGKFLYANVSVRPGNYMILFRNKDMVLSTGQWKAFSQTVEFTGEDNETDAESKSKYGPVSTTGTNTFNVLDSHKESFTQKDIGAGGETRQMWKVDYFEPNNYVIFTPTTQTVTKVGIVEEDPVGDVAVIYDNSTVKITPQGDVNYWQYVINPTDEVINWNDADVLHSTSETLDIATLIAKDGLIEATEAGAINKIAVRLCYYVDPDNPHYKDVTATYKVKTSTTKANVHVSFPYGIYNAGDFNNAANWTIVSQGKKGETSVGESTTATLVKDEDLTKRDPKKYEWYSTSVAVSGSDIENIALTLMDGTNAYATMEANNGTDAYFVVSYHENDTYKKCTKTTESDAFDAEVPLPGITATPSQVFVGVESAEAKYSVSDTEFYTVNGSDAINAGADGKGSGTFTVNDINDTQLKIIATNYAGYPLTAERTYSVNKSDVNGYYLVVNNERGGYGSEGEIKRYKFQQVLDRESTDLNKYLYTLTLPDFVLTGDQGRAENPKCFIKDESSVFNGCMFYTIQDGLGNVIYQPVTTKKVLETSTTNYKGHNEDGHTYLYLYNDTEKDKEHYITIDGKKYPMTKDDNMKINDHGPIWYYDFGTGDQSSTEFEVSIDWNPGIVIPKTTLFNNTMSTFYEINRTGDIWNAEEYKAPEEVCEEFGGNRYELGYGTNNKFAEKPNGGLTNVQLESYGPNINVDKGDDQNLSFCLKNDPNAKSYTWYLNIGETAYAPSANNPRFTSNPQSVAIAVNKKADSKNAIVEQKVINDDSKVQDYYLTGNLKYGADATTWQPVENKMKMTRMFFANKGKSYVAGNSEGITAANCDSIVYVLQMVRPEAGWGNMYLSMAGERNLDKYSNPGDVTAWWATLIRPQVFTNKDAQSNFGGLEVNGCLNYSDEEYSYITSYANTSQAINPILDNTVTGYTAYFNMTNATYRLVYYTDRTGTEADGLYIIGPAVAGFGNKAISGDDTYHAVEGRKVKLTFNPETGAYEAIGIQLNNGTFRFANIKQTTQIKNGDIYETVPATLAYESYYEEDAIIPVGDGELGNKAWFDANTWETHYFNLLSEPKVTGDVREVSDGKPVTFALDPGTYNVRFYTKYLGDNNETVTNAYYTIDYHIGIGDATASTDLSVGAGSAFSYHKTWSSRLAYVNNGLDAYYVSGWNWNKNEQKKTATASVTLSRLENPKYLAAEMPMILTDNAKNEDKLYVIVPGDPYGKQAAVQACKHLYSGTGIDVRPIYETEDYSDAMAKSHDDDDWKKWTEKVGPGAFDGEKYTKRNFTFAMIKPSWRNDSMKELDFWRVSSSNSKMTGHKFLVVADVPAGTDDLESGHAFTTYQTGPQAKSMANYMTIRFEGEADEEDSIATGIAENMADKADDCRIYNLMGVEVKTPIRGQVYIVNGRKVIMK